MELLPDKRSKRKQMLHGADEGGELALRRAKAARMDKTSSCHVASTTGDGEAQPQRTASQKRARVLWEDGVRLQKEGRLDEAYKAFTKALILCSCHSQTRRKFKEAGAPVRSIDPVGHCTCKDFVAAAQTRRATGVRPSLAFFPMSELDRDAVYALATARGCCCGSGRVRCSEPTHLELVDRLALVAAKLGRPADALRLAQYVVDLAPARPEGYLHLAKAVSEAQSDALRARFLARCVYTHGLHNVRRHGGAFADGRLVKVLAHCCKKYGHDDYIPLLPVETVEMIFRHLSLTDLLACCRVSKTWASVLCHIRIRLRRVALLGGACPPPKLLARLLRRFPRLETDELALFYVTKPERLPLLAAVALHHFAALHDLSLTLPDSLAAGTLEDVLRADVLPRSHQQRPLSILARCRRLHLGNVQLTNAPAALNLLAHASPSLEWLTLEGRAAGAVTFPLPRLVGLQVLGIDWSLAPGCDLLPSLCAAAGGLQQLSLAEVALQTMPGERGPAGYDAATALQSLQVLVVRRKFRLSETTWRPDPDAGGLFPALPAHMRCVDICCVDDHLTRAVLAALPACPQLELFRCQSSLLDDQQRPQQHHHQLFEHVLAPSWGGSCMELDDVSGTSGAGTLESLEISGEGREQALLHDPRLAVPFPDRLRNVGLYHVDWDPDPGLPGYVSGRTALQWLAQFRRAEAVAVYLRDERQRPALLLALVESIAQMRQQQTDEAMPRFGDCLHTIYDGSPASVVRDRAVQLAAHLGIRVVWSPDGRPPVFPWPAKEDTVYE